MEELKKAALDTIEENKELFASVADQIWEYAELSLQEVRSAAVAGHKGGGDATNSLLHGEA